MFDSRRINVVAFSYYDRLRKIEQYVNERYADKVSLETAARVAGLEEKYFSAFFHSKTGVCFKDWLAYIRVTRAMEMMKARDHSITTVAFTVGFQDLRTFERAFKRCTGLTPQAFKKTVRPF